MKYKCENDHEFENDYKTRCPVCNSNRIVWKSGGSIDSSGRLIQMKKENEELRNQISELKDENDGLRKKNEKYEQEKNVMIIVVCVAVFLFLLALILFIAATIKNRRSQNYSDYGESGVVEYIGAEDLIIGNESIGCSLKSEC